MGRLIVDGINDEDESLILSFLIYHLGHGFEICYVRDVFEGMNLEDHPSPEFLDRIEEEIKKYEDSHPV